MGKQDEVKVHIQNTKKQPKKPSIPHNRGRMMDFAPRNRAAVRRPRPTVVARKTTPTTPTPRPVPRPTAEPYTSKPPEIPTEPVGSIETATVATAVALPGYVEEREKEPTLSPEDIQRPEPVEPVSYRPVPPAHDPNSPFLSSVNIEKRPLSDQPITPPASVHPQHSNKNIYNHPQYEDKPGRLKQFNQTEILPSKKRPKIKMSMIFLIIATVLLGVAIGVLVYFAIFNNK